MAGTFTGKLKCHTVTVSVNIFILFRLIMVYNPIPLSVSGKSLSTNKVDPDVMLHAVAEHWARL